MPTITRNRTKEKTERKAFITERTREHLQSQNTIKQVAALYFNIS